jgi:hypothetical protein
MTISDRPDVLTGATYKIKTPTSEHAIYITINDIEYEGVVRPHEMFINSKNMEYFQWIAWATRIMSAIFRRTDDVSFLVEEMKVIFDPKEGNYFSNGKLMPSVVAEIGHVLETHLTKLSEINGNNQNHN